MKKILFYLPVVIIICFAISARAQVTAYRLDQMASYILKANGINMQGNIVVDPSRASGYAATIGNAWNSVIFVDPVKMRTLSPNTWAFILAHELSHIYLGHTGMISS